MKKCILSLAFSLGTYVVWAQPDLPVDPTPLPGMGMLAATAAVYGAKKMHERNN
jgi:hypothetical protein